MWKRFIVMPALLAACSGPRIADSELQDLAAARSPVAAVVEAHDTGLRLEADAPEPLAALEIEPHPVPEVSRYRLRRGETPAHFARWSGLPVEVIAEVSELPLDGSYPVGTEIAVPITGEAAAALETARQAHHARRAEGYLASRGTSVSAGFHTVRSGETAWTIATEQHGIPVWLLETYNPSADLDRLRPGQQLMVPVLADTVVDAELD